MEPAVTSTCRRPGSHQSQLKPGSVRREPSAAPISTQCSGSGTVPVSARTVVAITRYGENSRSILSSAGRPAVSRTRATFERTQSARPGSSGGRGELEYARRTGSPTPCRGLVRRQGTGQRVLVGEDDVGPVLRHGAVYRAPDEAVERNHVLVPQFPHRGHAHLVELAVGALAGRIDRHVRPDERAQVALGPAPGHVVPRGGQRVADGHGRPEVGHDGDDDEQEPGHAVIVAHIDFPDSS